MAALGMLFVLYLFYHVDQVFGFGGAMGHPVVLGAFCSNLAAG